MANLNLTQGTVETVNVTIQDTGGIISTLSGTTPMMTVIPYDSVAGADKSFYYAKYFMKTVLNSGMMIQALMDTSQGYATNTLEAASAPTLPVTITLNSNDTWKLGGTTFIIPAGVYTTVAALAAAVQNSLQGGVTPLYATPYGVNVVATDNGKLGFYSNRFLNTETAYNLVQITNGATHNALPTLGITSGQAFTTAGTSDSTPWAVGRYSLYVYFTTGAEKPFLGPIQLNVNAT